MHCRRVASPMRADGSYMDDPSAAVPARPLSRLGTPQPGFAAAATAGTGRWLSPAEAHARMQVRDIGRVRVRSLAPRPSVHYCCLG